MHVRPRLDYCDMIYHIPAKIKEMSDFDSCRSINYVMKTLKSTQYQAALAVSGAWKGTNREKNYEELRWETLDHRRMFRRLLQFYKIINGLTPTLLLHRHLYTDRQKGVKVYTFKDVADNNIFTDVFITPLKWEFTSVPERVFNETPFNM